MSDFLKALVSAVEKQKESDKDKGGKGGIIASIVIGLLAVMAMALLAWKQWRSGRELAKLKHQRAVEEEKALQAEADAKIAESRDKRIFHRVEANLAKAEAKRLASEIEKLEAERASNEDTIKKINSWEDVDEIVK